VDSGKESLRAGVFEREVFPLVGGAFFQSGGGGPTVPSRDVPASFWGRESPDPGREALFPEGETCVLDGRRGF